MTATMDHLGFKRKYSELRGGIFIPKYYNPEIEDRLRALEATHDMVHISTLISEKHIKLSTGHEIGKMAYGTGDIPFVRTSDISNWEVKTDPKQGVSQDIYAQYASRQDVRAGDILFVRDGTYLIGQSCFITEADLPCLYQSHILKVRVSDESPVAKEVLFACLNTPIVKRQIRAKQFTADIIDTIGNRFTELVLPVPKDQAAKDRIESSMRALFAERNTLRENIRKIPYWAQGLLISKDEPLSATLRSRAELLGNTGFIVKRSQIRDGIYIPKSYDPLLEADLHALSETHNLVPIGDLVKRRALSWSTGIEVGKMAYGTGDIPFLRTSDIANWEIKGDPKQSVSNEIYENNRQDVQAGDIFVVRDGTYLVGTSCIVTEENAKILYCGGLYKLRVNQKQKDSLDPHLLLALLNTPIVRRQMRSKQFTRDIIDTLGKRLFDVVLPVPKDEAFCQSVAAETRAVATARAQLHSLAVKIVMDLEGISEPTDDAAEVLREL